MKIQVVITTYNRPEQLALLLHDIYNQKEKVEVTIFDDGSQPPVKDAVHFQNHGKRRYYQLVTHVFKSLQNVNFDYFFMLPDDIRLCDNFFQLSINHWNIIQDAYKICLSVGHTHNRHYNPCWTKFTPVKINKTPKIFNHLTGNCLIRRIINNG